MALPLSINKPIYKRSVSSRTLRSIGLANKPTGRPTRHHPRRHQKDIQSCLTDWSVQIYLEKEPAALG